MRTLTSVVLILALNTIAPALAQGVNNSAPSGAPPYFNAQPNYNPSPTTATPNRTTNWFDVQGSATSRIPAQRGVTSRQNGNTGTGVRR